MADRLKKDKTDERQGQEVAYKGHALLQQPRIVGLVQHTDVGAESHRKGVDPHSEEGLAHYLQCMQS